MKVLLIVAAVVELMGIVFLLQGVGVLGGSRMTGQSEWAVIGGILVVASWAAIAVAVSRLRRG